MDGVSFLIDSNNCNGMEWAVGIVKEVYTKCKDDFLFGLLVHHTTPLLYIRSKLSPAELFSIIICSVVGVPDSFVVEINGQQYRRNKCQKK